MMDHIAERNRPLTVTARQRSVDSPKVKRRWTVRVTVGEGEAWIVVEAPREAGVVHASLGETTVRLTPEELSKLRQVYLEALAVALYDRGSW